MLRYMASLNKSLDEVLVQWAGRLAEEFMRETPPFVDKSASNKDEARRRGERAAKKALMESVTPASMIFKRDFKNKAFERIVKRKQYEKFNQIRERMPKLQNWKAERFSPELHIGNRPVGRFDYLTPKKVLTFDEQKYKQYERKLVQRIGYMKAGWGIAAAALGRDVPGWISRHLGYAKGNIEINLQGDNKYIRFENNTPTIQRFAGRYNYAMDWVAKRMIKQMEFILRSEAKKRNNQ